MLNTTNAQGVESAGLILPDTVVYGDCLAVMPYIPDNSVDMVLCDLPYGISRCRWDLVIPLEPLWEQYKRIITNNGVIVLTACQPFTTTLITSNMQMFKYCWVWEKSKGLNFVHAKNMPIRFTEDIVVFSSAPIGHKTQLGNRRMTYNPQGLVKVNKEWRRPRKYETDHKSSRPSHKLDRILEYENYPRNIIKISNSSERGLHPVQKPVALMEYLIKTYTNEGDLVLDNCAGSFTTAVASDNLKRDWICIEKEKSYCDVGEKRINKNRIKLNSDLLGKFNLPLFDNCGRLQIQQLSNNGGNIKMIDLTGKKFGKLLVIKQSEERGNSGQIRWECICDCGNKHVTSGESIRGGKSKSCGCNRLVPPNKEKDRELAIWKQLYNSTIIKRSKKRGYKSDISFKDFKTLSLQKCFYCGLLPSNFATDKRSGKKISNTIIKYNGIDRINNSRGYLKNNSVACCKYCNTAKNTMTQKEFMKFIKRIYEYNF